MQIQLAQRIKWIALTVSVAALGYQPAMKASMQIFSQPAETPESLSSAVTTTAAMPFSTNAQTPLSKNTQNTVLAQNSEQGAAFVSAAHPTQGAAQIVEIDGQRYLEFDQTFRSDSGPDLFVLLHNQAVPESYSADEFVNLGRIQALEGTQRYAIPADVDVASLQSAVIWCRAFNVTFGYATL